MANIANATCVWAKDGNGNVYQIQDRAKHPLSMWLNYDSRTYSNNEAYYKKLDDNTIKVSLHLTLNTYATYRSDTSVDVVGPSVNWGKDVKNVKGIYNINVSQMIINGRANNGPNPSFSISNGNLHMFITSGYDTHNASFDLIATALLDVDLA